MLHAPTEHGPVWFKANIPELAFEVAILETLAARRPESSPRLLDADRSRGWMLLEDAGHQLNESSLERWAAAVRGYAELQLAVAADADALVEAGVPDRRGRALLDVFALVLDDDRSIRGLDHSEVAALRALMPRLEDAVAAVDELELPNSVQHDDLHPWNVFLRDGDYVVIDWGDACIAQPLLSLSVPLSHAERDAAYIRDAYLAPWTALRPRAELVEAVEPAMLLAHVTGVLKWALIFSGLTDEELGDSRGTIAFRLRHLLEHVYR